MRNIFMKTTWIIGIILIMAGCSTPSSAETEILYLEMPVTASPNVHKVIFYSNSLKQDMRFNIYLPSGYSEDRKYPVIYMIHGYGGNENSWIPGLSMDRMAEQLLEQGKIDPVIIVSLQANNSYGLNSANKSRSFCQNCLVEGRYNDYIRQDLIEFVDGHYSTVADREGRFIGGLSMGGWAALHTAFQYPDMFSKVGGHSPALWLDDWSKVEGLESFLYPSQRIRAKRDPIELAKTTDLSNLAVYLDCGDKDWYEFYKGAGVLNEILEGRNVQTVFHLNAGAHDDAYWRSHMEDYLLFYAGK